MPERDLLIKNPSGLHARPAATFVRAAAGFSADVRVANLDRDPEKAVSAKSMLGVMGIGAVAGHRIRLTAVGDDAEQALRDLAALVEAGLGERADGVEPS